MDQSSGCKESLDHVILQSLRDAVIVTDQLGEIIRWNKGAEEMFGYGVGEVLGRDLSKTLTEKITSRDRPQLMRYFDSYLPNRTETTFESIFIKESGDEIPVEMTLIPKWSEGRWIQLVVLRNLTECRGENLKLHKIDNLFRILSDHAQDAIVYFVPGKGYEYVSPSIKHILGFDPDELIQGSTAFFFYPEDHDLFEELCMRILEGHNWHKVTARVRHKAGYYLWIETVCSVQRDMDGSIKGIIGIGRDITERKIIEEDLRRSKEGLKLAQKIAGLGYWDRDLQNEELFWSNEMYQIWGIPQEDSAPTTEEIYSIIHPEDFVFVKESISSIEEFMDIEFRVVHANQSIHVVHSVATKLCDSTGTPIRLFGIVQDITSRKLSEDMMVRSETLSAVGQLAAGLAHEIRNPLTSIKGFTQLLTDEKGGKYSEIIQSELQRIEMILHEMLMLAKPQAIAFKLHRLNSVLEDVMILLCAQALLRNVRVLADFEDDDLFVYCDPNQLKQVFVNMMKNAIESMQSGGDLRIFLVGSFDRVVATFADEGEGIPSDTLLRLGQPFVSTKSNGIGLGFMVSQKIIHDHGGIIEVNSEVGVGTTMVITLPRAT